MERGTDDRQPQEIAWWETPFQVAVGEYELLLMPDGRPGLYDRYLQQARLAEEFGLDVDVPMGRTAFLAVRHRAADWPFLVVAQRYAPHAVAADCGAVLLPETRRLFIAAGERLLAYDITPDHPHRLWEDVADSGFWRWRVHDDVVLMAAELALAAWDAQARRLWSVFVEPPWDYRIESGMVLLDVMGRTSRFPLHSGPPPMEHART